MYIIYIDNNQPKAYGGKGFQGISITIVPWLPLFRQFLFYLSFLPKTEKWT